MSQPIINTLTVVGVGLIGGSFSRALKAAGVVQRVIGVDLDADNLALALRLGVVDEVAPSLAAGVRSAQVVFVAVPVGAVPTVVAQASPFLTPGCIVTDGGSVKEQLVEVCEPLMPAGTFFVGGHPIAGTEHSGAAAAFGELFQGRRCILTPTATTDAGALGLCRCFPSAPYGGLCPGACCGPFRRGRGKHPGLFGRRFS